MKYVGCHSTTIKPELDSCYLGSGTALPIRDRFSCKKEILSQHPNRREAIKAEIAYIEKHDCVRSNKYYNQRLKTFDKHGSKLSEEHKSLISQTQTGKCRKIWGKKYSGKGRTPAQIAGQKRAAEKIRGTKNPAKGRKGILNNDFRPWYYITPEGIKTEVYDVTKKDYASRLGFTHRQITHRFHYTNQHKPGKKHPFKGWIFGDIKTVKN